MKRFFMAMMAALLCSLCAASLAEERVIEPSSITVNAETMSGTVELHATCINGEEWLFLPAFADVAELTVAVDGTLVSYELEEGKEHVWHAALSDGTEMNIMRSENLRSAFLFSSDPVHQGREYIENSERHSRSTTGRLAIVDQNGFVDYTGSLDQIRGRGNGTWGREKKSYQFKLKYKEDLLRTGIKSEKARTWVLLAEASDPTFLHTRISFDLALEMGIEETSYCEHVDLYYDGEYRGLYLLCEKNEIHEARINEINYDDLIETWNEYAGTGDLEALPVGSATNRFGHTYTYIEGLEDGGMVDAGAYLLELESSNGFTLTNRCHFRVDENNNIALKTPENASKEMVRFISERLMEARQTLQNGGVHPETGRTIEDDFDVDEFARHLLIHELTANSDSFNWSSTFFMLPAGSLRFTPGPLWDFESSWTYFSDHSIDWGVGFKEKGGWMADFYQCDTFVEAMKRIWINEIRPLVCEILLGNADGKRLCSLETYAQAIAASAKMNSVRWSVNQLAHLTYAEDHESFADNLLLLRQFAEDRIQWFDRILIDMKELGPDCIDINLKVLYGHADEKLAFQMPAWSQVNLESFDVTLMQEATETDYAVYRTEAFFVTSDGTKYDNPQVFVNGKRVNSEMLPDGKLRICFAFTDPSYRPVDYYGEDVGMVYQYEYYIEHYPYVAEMYGDDPAAVLDYFFDEGIYLGEQGNVFFSPYLIKLYNPYLEDIYGEDWQNYYWDFLAYGRDEGWLDAQDQRFRPEVTDLL